jgi:hypothetical protein
MWSKAQYLLSEVFPGFARLRQLPVSTYNHDICLNLFCSFLFPTRPSGKSVVYFEFWQDRLPRAHSLNPLELVQRSVKMPLEARFVTQQIVELRRQRNACRSPSSLLLSASTEENAFR